MKTRLHQIYRRHRFVSSIAMLIFLFVFGAMGLVVVNGETLEPNDSHVVSLYVDGQDYTIPTRAQTVGELIERADINVSEHDSVEPSRETKIEVDRFRIRVIRARPYIVKDGTKEHSALSAHTSARLIAEAAGLTLKPADKVDFAAIDELALSEIGRVIEIKRSKQVTISIYGSLQIVNTNSASVQNLLNELGISLAADDELFPSMTQEIYEGLQVAVNRKGVRTVTEEQAINSPVEYIEDLNLTVGSSVVRDPGKPGKKVITYEVITENEIEISRKEISSVITEQPTIRVVARGRASGQIGAEREQLMRIAGIPESEFASVNYIIGQESGWCATKWQGQYGRCPEFYEELHDPNDSRYGYGLCQSTPGIKMASIAEDWQTNAVAQLQWCYNYMKGYGSANAAADFKLCLGECYSPRTKTTVFKKTTWF
jgi:uncharacterized protein YabE (DUF348 family)